MANVDTDKFNEELDDLVKRLGLFGAAADKLKAELKTQYDQQQKQNKLNKETLSLDEVMSKLRKEEIDREQKRKEVANNLTNVMRQNWSSMLSMTQSVHGINDSFTRLTPVVDIMSNTIKSVVEAIGTMASGASAFGFSFGRLPEGIAKMLGSGVGLLSDIVKAQLQNMQRVSNAYLDVVKAGATFGTGVEGMAKMAHSAGVDMQTLGSILKSNAENIAALGDGLSVGSAAATKFARNMGETNPKLEAMYGGLEGLTGAIVDFKAEYMRSGFSKAQIDKLSEKTIGDYLRTQKELTELTGQSVDAQKKEAAARAQVLAFQQKLADIGPEAAANINASLNMIGSSLGAPIQKVVMEMFNTNGKVMNEENQKTYSIFRGQIDALYANLTESQGKSAEENVKAQAAIIQQLTPEMRETMLKNPFMRSLAEVSQAGAGGDYAKSVTEMGSQMLIASGKVAGYNKTLDAITETRGKTDEATLQLINQFHQTLGANIEKDKIAIASFAQTNEVLKLLNDANMKLIKATGGVVEAMSGLVNGDMKALRAGIATLLDQMGMTDAAAKLRDETPTPNNEPSGGLETSPHGVGAASGGMLSGPASGYNARLHGTELVVPMNNIGGIGQKLSELPPAIQQIAEAAGGGRIDPAILGELQQQTSLARQMVDKMRDMADSQERIAINSY